MKKLLVLGNAALDGIVNKEVFVNIHSDDVFLSYDNERLKLSVVGGPIKPGGKYNAMGCFREQVVGLPFDEQFGGGGYNSVMALKKITTDDVYYLDLSTPSLDSVVPGTSLANRLSASGIFPCFISARPMPFNVVLGSRADKIIIKSKVEPPILGEYHYPTINHLMQICDGVLFNSLKEEALVELAVSGTREQGKTLVGCITTSLDPDFVLKKVVPYAVCQFNYDEFGYIMNPDHGIVGDENTRIESAVEGLRKLRMDYGCKQNTYVTLGSNGALCCDGISIYHIKLTDDVLKDIALVVDENPASTCGAGDAHAGSVFYGEVLGMSLLDTAKKACKTALRHLGYDKRVINDDFVVKKVGQVVEEMWYT